MKTEQDVNEATAALKGLLGLGTPTNAVIDSVSETDPVPIASVTTTPNNTKKKRNSNNKKKKGNESAKSEEKTSTKDTNRNKLNNITSNKKKKNSKKKVTKEPETYALSAFQSSPDASKLPIPEFTSPVYEKKALSPGEFTPLELLTDVSAEHNVDIFESKGDNGKRATVEEEEAVVVNDKEPEAESRNDAPVSTTGVNLAMLAAKQPVTDKTSSSTLPPPALMDNLPQHPMQLPQHLPHFGAGPPNAHVNHMSYMHHQMPNFASPMPPQYQLHMHHHPYNPPPPPGYILIQVQIPPVLMPGRQMLVTTPSGFPVQVIVPEGIPAGAWMPVHVPGTPPHIVPHPMMQPPPPPPSAMFERIDDNNQYSPPRLG